MTNEELILEYQKGDTDALQEILLNNQGLIYYTLKKFYYEPQIEEDLVQVGYIAIMKAVEKFVVRDTKFSTYAYKCIYGYVARYLKKNDTSIEVSMDKPIGGDTEGNIQTIADTLQDNIDIEEDYSTVDYQEQLRRDLYRTMQDKVTPIEQDLLILHYGLEGEPIPLSDISELLNINSKATRDKAMLKMRRGANDPRYLKRYKDDIKDNINSFRYKNINSLINAM